MALIATLLVFYVRLVTFLLLERWHVLRVLWVHIQPALAQHLKVRARFVPLASIQALLAQANAHFVLLALHRVQLVPLPRLFV